MLGLLSQLSFIAAIILWSIIIVTFVVVKLRNVSQRKKYSVKQSGDVTTEYHHSGLE